MKSYTVYFIWKLLYMFRVVPPPIIRSANNCIYSICYLSHRYCYLPLWRQVALTMWQIPDAVDTVICAPDVGWWYYPKHVEQFPYKINCVTLQLVGYAGWSQKHFLISSSYKIKTYWNTAFHCLLAVGEKIKNFLSECICSPIFIKIFQ